MRTKHQTLGAGEPDKGDMPAGQDSGGSVSADAIQAEMDEVIPFLQQPRRWVPHRKAEVVAAVRSGLLSLDEARERFALSIDEFLSWKREIDLYGLAGLRVNRTQKRRRAGPPAATP